jgi:hypothetical protein
MEFMLSNVIKAAPRASSALQKQAMYPQYFRMSRAAIKLELSAEEEAS